MGTFFVIVGVLLMVAVVFFVAGEPLRAWLRDNPKKLDPAVLFFCTTGSLWAVLDYYFGSASPAGTILAIVLLCALAAFYFAIPHIFREPVPQELPPPAPTQKTTEEKIAELLEKNKR